eukprot:6654264-Prymnesium_polylepis.1
MVACPISATLPTSPPYHRPVSSSTFCLKHCATRPPLTRNSLRGGGVLSACAPAPSMPPPSPPSPVAPLASSSAVGPAPAGGAVTPTA